MSGGSRSIIDGMWCEPGVTGAGAVAELEELLGGGL